MRQRKDKINITTAYRGLLCKVALGLLQNETISKKYLKGFLENCRGKKISDSNRFALLNGMADTVSQRRYSPMLIFIIVNSFSCLYL